jgi:hypothetical protein
LGKDVIRRKDGGLWTSAVQCHVYDDQVRRGARETELRAAVAKEMMENQDAEQHLKDLATQ